MKIIQVLENALLVAGAITIIIISIFWMIEFSQANPNLY